MNIMVSTAPHVLADDPFSLVLDALWSQCFEKHQPLMDLVKPGNRIKRIDEIRPDKPLLQDADLVELDIVPTDWDLSELFLSSSGSRIVQAYEVRMTTGEKDSRAVSRIKWEVLRAVSQLFRSENDGGIPQNLGLPFVLKTEILGQTDSLDDTILKRKRSGWTALMMLGVHLNFDRQTQLWADVPTLLANTSED